MSSLHNSVIKGCNYGVTRVCRIVKKALNPNEICASFFPHVRIFRHVFSIPFTHTANLKSVIHNSRKLQAFQRELIVQNRRVVREREKYIDFHK